ncbi:MAG: aminoglycoside phosphotransferase [Bacteroidaceae bacterium]|nr:aminoglycoside phosphotransferase [Bacteroidaceae bacterium]
MNILNEKYRYLQEYIEEIPNIFDHEGTAIHVSRNVIKIFHALDGTVINAKRYHAPKGINALIYSIGIRKPKGYRAYMYSSVLRGKGIETPEAIAYMERRKTGILRESYLVTVQCPYGHRMYELGDAQEGTYEDIAVSLAQYTARLHENGILHRDYSPGNILWEKDAAGQYRFSLVDINRMDFGPVDLKHGCSNLKRLWGPKRFFLLVVHEYAKARGFNQEEAERIALEARAAFWTRFSQKHRVKFKLEL